MFKKNVLTMGVLLTYALVSFILSADTKDSIEGYVYDESSNEPIEAVIIKCTIENHDHFTTTDSSGKFTLPNTPHGRYSLRVEHIGYVSVNMEITPESHEDKRLVIYLKPDTYKLNQVTVTDRKSVSIYEDYADLGSVLKGKELEKEMGLSLAGILKNEAGMAMRTMGPAPARPVVRGLGGDRVLLSEDGVKISDLSATSADHAVTVEPFTVKRIEVKRGPILLTQTSTTIGGVIDVINNDVITSPINKVNAYTGAFYETASRGRIFSAGAEVPLGSFVFSGNGVRKVTTDMNSAMGKVGNSYINNSTYSGGVSYIFGKGYIGTAVKEFNMTYGVPGGFVGAHPNGVDIDVFKRNNKVRAGYNFNNNNNLRFAFERNYYRHKEFEKSGDLGAEFKIENYFANLDYNHSNMFGFHNGIWGASYEYRDFDIGGRVNTPHTNSQKTSFYMFENYVKDKLSTEFAARFEYNLITPEIEYYSNTIGYVREKDFTTYSLSFSGIYEISKVVHLGVNLSKSSRVPTIEELFSGGPHLAAYSYEVGNPELNVEKGYGSEIFIFHKFEKLKYNLSFFGNFLSSYIIPVNSGRINYQTFLPIYEYKGVDAKLYGSEYFVEWEFANNIILHNTGSYTVGKYNDTGKPLPTIPPFKGELKLTYKQSKYELSVETVYAAPQNDVDEFELPTAGYMLLNVGGQYSFKLFEAINNISLNVENILSKEYRNHLSRIKSILPEEGINARITYKIYY